MSTNKETKNRKIEAIYNYLNDMPEDANIDIESQKQLFFDRVKTKKKNHLYTYFKYAAAIILFATSAYFFTNNEEKAAIQTVVNETETSTQILVGTDKATLTLEDGSNVVLEKGREYKDSNLKSNGEKLVYNSKKDSQSEIKYNYLTIPRGGQYFVQLADGTNVWLNSDSKLKYPVSFNNDSPRKVELIYGEAYFDVSPSENHNGTRFIVTTKDQDVVVLGTEFNVKAYKEDDIIATTLVEGKVTIDNNSIKRQLSPNNQSRFNSITKEIDIVPVEVKHEIAWKKGLFSFRNKPFEDIMLVISRWYDVDVVFENEDTKALTFNGVFNKKLSIEEILLVIETSKEAQFEIKDKTIYMK